LTGDFAPRARDGAFVLRFGALLSHGLSSQHAILKLGLWMPCPRLSPHRPRWGLSPGVTCPPLPSSNHQNQTRGHGPAVRAGRWSALLAPLPAHAHDARLHRLPRSQHGVMPH